MWKLTKFHQSRCILVLCLIINLAVIPNTLLSGPTTDRLSVCLVENASTADKVSLVRWIFLALAAHPDVNDLSDVSARKEVVADVEAAKIIQRLITRDCMEEVKTALIIDGDVAIEASFTILGQVAARSLMENPQVAQRSEGFIQYLDPKSFDVFK